MAGAGSVQRVRSRRCSRSGCSEPAAATLTYVYSDSTAVLGPLATQVEPHGYDLCRSHAAALSVPRGWEVIRLAGESDPRPSTDDLLALADAVREVGLSYDPAPLDEPTGRSRPGAHRNGPHQNGPHQNGIVELRRRGHLTVLADPDA